MDANANAVAGEFDGPARGACLLALRNERRLRLGDRIFPVEQDDGLAPGHVLIGVDENSPDAFADCTSHRNVVGASLPRRSRRCSTAARRRRRLQWGRSSLSATSTWLSLRPPMTNFPGRAV